MAGMTPKDCTECQRLSGQYWELSAEADRAQDELIMTPKNDLSYAAKKADASKLAGLVKDVLSRLDAHRASHRS
jgi:hypothetical protein